MRIVENRVATRVSDAGCLSKQSSCQGLPQFRLFSRLMLAVPELEIHKLFLGHAFSLDDVAAAFDELPDQLVFNRIRQLYFLLHLFQQLLFVAALPRRTSLDHLE